MIAVVDYGIGNVGSICNMLKRVGLASTPVQLPDDIVDAKSIILPGVGAFDRAMEKLKDSGWFERLNGAVLEQNMPVLGVCLGMQLMFDGSEEGSQTGFGWIEGSIERFDFSSIEDIKSSNDKTYARDRLAIPHMRWNTVEGKVDDNLFDKADKFYFVHSYHAKCLEKNHILASTDYGYSFTSAVRKGNITGVQFHPEKSHRFGIKFFSRYFGLEPS